MEKIPVQESSGTAGANGNIKEVKKEYKAVFGEQSKMG